MVFFILVEDDVDLCRGVVGIHSCEGDFESVQLVLLKKEQNLRSSLCYAQQGRAVHAYGVNDMFVEKVIAISVT